jgi:hypothetical protein
MEEKDLITNSISFAGVFAYLMQFQAEITFIVLITALILNTIRIYDRFRHGPKKNEN